MASKTGVLAIVVAVLLAGFTGGVTVASLTDTETVGVSIGINETPATEGPATPGELGENTTATPNGTSTPNATTTPNSTETPNGTSTPTATPTPTPTPTATPTPTPTPTETGS